MLKPRTQLQTEAINNRTALQNNVTSLLQTNANVTALQLRSQLLQLITNQYNSLLDIIESSYNLSSDNLAESTTSILEKIGDGTFISSAYLPSYVDDILSYSNLASFPIIGETGKIYISEITNKQYRWSGSSYVQVGNSDVNSVFGRTGIVTPAFGDYTAELISFSSFGFTDVKSALIEILTYYESINNKDNDPTLSSMSPERYPTQYAVSRFVETSLDPILNAIDFQRTNELYIKHDYIGSTFVNHEYSSSAAISTGVLNVHNTAADIQNRFGVVRVVSSATINSGWVHRLNATNQFRLDALSATYEAQFIFNSQNGSTRIQFGIIDTATSVESTNGVYFFMDGLSCVGKQSNAGTRSSTSVFTLSLSTWYKAKLSFDRNSGVTIFNIYNMSGVIIFTNSVTTNSPGVSSLVNVGWVITTNTAAALTLALIDYQDFRIKNLIR